MSPLTVTGAAVRASLQVLALPEESTVAAESWNAFSTHYLENNRPPTRVAGQRPVGKSIIEPDFGSVNAARYLAYGTFNPGLLAFAIQFIRSSNTD